MTKHIDVYESISDKDSDFNIKRFKISKLNVDRPIKTIDSRSLTQSLFQIEEPYFENIIFETPINFTQSKVNNIINERSGSQINSNFGYVAWQHAYDNLISPTFNFNPYNHYNKIEKISGFFDYYYQFSKTFTLVPNIKAIKNIYENTKNGKKKKVGEQPIIKSEDYLKFINESYEILDFKNNKPIFAPLSLNFSMTETEAIAKNYIKNEYSNIWIDFEGATSTNLAKTGRLRSFYRVLKKAEILDETVIYATNLRREITSNKSKSESPSSDVFASLYGANFIGVNKDPIASDPPPVPQTPEEQQKIWNHKARVFNPDTYYYVKRDLAGYDNKTSNNLSIKEYNKLFNSKLLNNELNNQKTHFLDNFDFEDYIKNKRMVSDYKGGSLIKHLFYKKYQLIQTSLGDDFSMP